MNARLTLLATAAFATILSSCAPGAGTADAAQSPQADDEPGWRWSDERVFATVNAVRAGRDLTPASWPGGARAAVLLSFDVDNETIPIRNGQPTIGGLSQGEYGARRALPRIIELLDEHDIPASFFIPAMSLQFNPEMLDAIQAAGHHEIGIHGWIHETNSLLEADEERALLERAVAYLTEVTGERPVGYRAPSWNFSPNTLDIILDMDFLYDSSLMADDRPYEIVANGEPTGLIELPVEWILDDAPLLNPRGNSYSAPRDVLQVYIDEFDRAWEEGTMLVLTMHPHYIGHRSRILILEGLIEHINARGDVWYATHRAVAEYVQGG